MKFKLTVIALLSLCSTQIFAHALWIETSPNGIKGKPQEVKIFFDEYAMQRLCVDFCHAYNCH